MTYSVLFAAWCAVWCIGLTWAHISGKREADRKGVRHG